MCWHPKKKICRQHKLSLVCILNLKLKNTFANKRYYWSTTNKKFLTFAAVSPSTMIIFLGYNKSNKLLRFFFLLRLKLLDAFIILPQMRSQAHIKKFTCLIFNCRLFVTMRGKKKEESARQTNDISYLNKEKINLRLRNVWRRRVHFLPSWLSILYLTSSILR